MSDMWSEVPELQSPKLVDLRDKTLSFLSLSSSLMWHKIGSQKLPLEKGTLVVSIDIDVGHSNVGKVNQGKNDRNVSSYLSERMVGKFEEVAVPLLARFFEEAQVPVTFAVRGQLLEVDAALLNSLLESSARIDIASHGYYHRAFNKLSIADAEKELGMISERMKEFNITPRSFIFPRNNVAHLKLLEKYGYLCYRGKGGLTRNGMYIVKKGDLFDVHPSLFINRNASLQLLRKLLSLSISKRAPLHLWFHPLDFGPVARDVTKNIALVLQPFFNYAKSEERNGLLAFHTMLSIAQQLQRNADDRVV
jgi:hypothetical protein